MLNNIQRVQIHLVAQQVELAVGQGPARVGAEAGQGLTGRVQGELRELVGPQVDGHGPAPARVVGRQGAVDFGQNGVHNGWSSKKNQGGNIGPGRAKTSTAGLGGNRPLRPGYLCPMNPTADPALAARPIGLFDSGIGGLTVARAVAQRLPHERLVYFGDTAHLPYGDKSTAAIQAYAVKICDVLLRQHCKVILIACNSASAAAYELVREYVGSKAQVLNVIDPIVAHVGQHYAGRRVGLIGTKQTVNSNVYRKKLDALDAGIDLAALATPLLVPMIEEGFLTNAISDDIIATYLGHPALAGVEALVLACTHFPLIKPHIDRYYAGRTDVLDASDAVAAHAEAYLAAHGLLAPPADAPPMHHFYVSDFTPSFEESTRLFFGQEVRLEHYPLWE